ncbi:MAG TPA: MFS transporter [Ktedonobacteraceae bacterium]|nr:MFS transporter [Ktedonobacteraceae bacterium]
MSNKGVAASERGGEDKRSSALSDRREGGRPAITGETIAVSRRSLIAVIAAILLLRFASRISFVILGFYLGRHFASVTIVALVLEMFYVSEFTLSPIVGSLSDRKGRKPFLLLSAILAAGAASCFLLAARLFPHPGIHSSNFGLFLFLLIILVGRLLEGSATGTNVPATLGYITDVTVNSESLRARMVTAFEIATMAGMVLAIPIAGKISSTLDTWGFLIVIAIYIASLLFIALGMEESLGAQAVGHNRRFAWREDLMVIRHKRIFSFLPAWFSVNALVGAWSVLITIMLAYPNPAADRRHPAQLLYGGFSQMSATLWVGLFALVFLVGMGVWTPLLPRMRRTTIMLIALAGLAMTAIALSIINSLADNPQSLPHSAHPAVALLLLLALVGILLLSGFTPVALTQMSALAETLPGKNGAVMGLYSVVMAVGQLLGAMLGAVSVDRDGFYGLMIFSVAMGILALVSVLYVRINAHDQTSARRVAWT